MATGGNLGRRPPIYAKRHAPARCNSADERLSGDARKPLDSAVLDADVRRGLSELETWNKVEEGLTPGGCDKPAHSFVKLVKLSQLALSSATAADADRPSP